MSKPYKIRVVGVGGVGKSALTIQFIRSEFVEEYVPTIEESYLKDLTIEGIDRKLDILDTAGQEEYSALRDTYMRGGEGFLLVYSTTEGNSLTELEEFYQQILMVKNADNAPMVLVGNKCDLTEEREVERAEGEEQASSWNIPFFETSAKTNKNVREAFEALSKEIEKERINNPDEDHVEVEKPNTGKGTCCIIL